MNTAEQHPAPQRLLQFARGELAESDFAAVEMHLETCDSCCNWIAQQPDDPLLALAREVATLHGGRTLAAPLAPAREVPTALREHPRYDVLEHIGGGGMGSVFKAMHRKMQRTVALKVIHPALLSHSAAVERFEREVRIAAQLSHPHIVVAYDADQAGDLHFLVMEYVEGESLDQHVAKRGPVSVVEACDWIRQAALGLEYASELGMVHRDIKPQNLMLTPDRVVKVLDFGLSRMTSEELVRTAEADPTPHAAPSPQTDLTLGTPDYIAPEQIADSRGVDVRVDIYSLGCTLFFLLAGKPPYGTKSIESQLRAHRSQRLPRITDLRNDVPPRLVEILDRMTAKAPGERFQHPREVASALAEVIGGRNIENAAQAPTRTISLSRRRAAVVIGLAFAGLLIAAIVSPDFRAQFLPPTRPPARLLVMLPSQGLWFPDYQSLVDAAKEANTELIFTGTSDQPSEVVHTSVPGIAMADVPLSSSITAGNYDGIVFIGLITQEFLPGGSASEDTQRLIHDFQRQKKVVASLCAGQRVLAQQGALRGKKVATCQSVSHDEIFYGGGTRTDSNVEVDGLVVTAASANFAPEFLASIRKLISP